MDFKHIEAFVKVIELSSFSKAAEEIFLSQPSVSTYISTVEAELGEVLINRSTKEVTPTLAGKIFYESAKEILAVKCNAVEQVKNLSKNFSGEINILASSVPAQYILPEVLTRFKASYPDISFNVKQADTFKTTVGIATQTAEIGFSGDILENEKCEFKELMSERLLFIAPYNQGFCRVKRYSLEELLYANCFIAREKGSGTRLQYEKFFEAAKINLNQINMVSSFDNTQSIITAVMNGLGIAIVSEFAAKMFIKQKLVVPIKLQEEIPIRKFYYVLKKNFPHSHLVELFVKFLVNS